jgi:hypothetical protein
VGDAMFIFQAMFLLQPVDDQIKVENGFQLAAGQDRLLE